MLCKIYQLQLRFKMDSLFGYAAPGKNENFILAKSIHT